ncbi:exopolyphosphatase [Adlercreutzia sp. R21]|uniref:Exopolyphosphatase n=1 Tax=Adlercreutzia wanghongyangiae TaxID=3111451 RepID=A0ABU6IIH7_9ACTN|nr:exopolyphosphatase [Adlercreutzia sp. R21]MEC4176222.1 exopolyphosphatase [Adlercreutzia sp. R7]MEC4184306.1 exopolyphosphatase [Adlercreutzia sp. R21]
MARYGVIDLGSNSVRLVIYEVKRHSDAAKPFRTLADEKKMAGLAAYVVDGLFSDAGIQRAADILQEHLKSARNLDCDRVDIFATAVLRNCRNSDEAVKAIERAIDARVRVLTAAEEARLGWAGARIGQDMWSGTLIDIGGGSTELTSLTDTGHPRTHPGGASLPQGSVSSYAQFVSLVLPTAEECRAIAAALSTHLEALADEQGYRAERLYGIGGSVRAIAKMQAQALGVASKPPVVPRAAIDRLFNLLETDPSTFAHSAVKACPDRVHTLVPGMVIARTVMETLGADTITVCKYGIREGYLVECML